MADYSAFDLPEDPTWTVPEMLIRHAVACREKTTKQPAELVAVLDEYGSKWGLERHGSISVEPDGSGIAVASYFKIVDIGKFVAENKRFLVERIRHKIDSL